MRMPLLIFLLTFTFTVVAQDSTFCRVMQFSDEDSANAKEQLTIVYNQRGQVTSETYGRFEVNCLNYNIGYSVKYVYNDTLLVEKIESVKQESPYRYVYTYDELGRVKTESKFVWIIDPGATPVHRPGMPVETNVVGGKWNQVGLASISYDTKGRKILYDATRLSDRNENMEKWQYDDQNRITCHEVFGHGKLLRKTDYTYYEGGYRKWEVYYTADGDLKSEMEDGQGYQSIRITIYTLDKSGRILTEKLTTEKGIDQCIKYYWYDKQGRIIRTTCYDKVGIGMTTHVYNYPK